MKHLILTLILFPVFASADEAAVQSCRSQIDLYCEAEKQHKDFRGIIKCLIRNDQNLSIQCKQEIQRFSQASRQTRPPSGGSMGAIGGLAGMGAQIPTFNYEGRFLNGKNQTPHFREHSINTSIPVYKQNANTLAVSLMGSTANFGTSLILNSGEQVPNNLNRAEIGAQYSRQLDGQRLWGLRTTMGFSGDKVHEDTAIYNITANYSFPTAEQNRWVLMVMLSNNSPLGTFIPVPGFFYMYRTPTFTGLFGLPIISFQWTPLHPWAFSFSAFGPTIKTELTYGAIDKTQYYTAFAWRQQRYMISDRTYEDDRVTVEEKSFELGLREPIGRGVVSEIAAGKSFDRSVYIGDGLFNDDRGNLDLDSSYYLRWSIRAAF